jgi:hypothetical protein
MIKNKAKKNIIKKKKIAKPAVVIRTIKTKKENNKVDKADNNRQVDILGRDMTSVANRVAKDKAKILFELERTFGIVSNAIAKAKISNTTFYKWYKEDKDFKKAVDEVQEGFDVIVEDKLKQKIIQNDGHSIRFYLSHRVKKYRPNIGLGQAEDLEPIQMTIVTRKTKKDDNE